MICGAYACTSHPMHILCWPICGHLGPKSAYQSRFVGSCLGRTDFADFACLAHWRLAWVAVAFTLNPSYIDTRPHWPHLRWLLALVLRSAPNPFHRFRHRRRPLERSKSRRVFVSGAALSFGLKELREIEAAGALRSVGATRARCGLGPARPS